MNNIQTVMHLEVHQKIFDLFFKLVDNDNVSLIQSPNQSGKFILAKIVKMITRLMPVVLKRFYHMLKTYIKKY